VPGQCCSRRYLLLQLTVAARHAGIFVVQPHKLEEFVVPDLDGCEVRCLRPARSCALGVKFWKCTSLKGGMRWPAGSAVPHWA